MKVRTLSRTFFKGHPRAGEETLFVERACASLAIPRPEWIATTYENGIQLMPKHHTIRMGRRFKPVDELCLAVWSDKPYRSKQIKIWSGPIRAVDIEIIIHDKEQKHISPLSIVSVTQHLYRSLSIDRVAANDGLTQQEFTDWFALKPGIHEAQILIWNPDVNY